jgi:hypothetical protein
MKPWPDWKQVRWQLSAILAFFAMADTQSANNPAKESEVIV